MRKFFQFFYSVPCSLRPLSLVCSRFALVPPHRKKLQSFFVVHGLSKASPCVARVSGSFAVSLRTQNVCRQCANCMLTVCRQAGRQAGRQQGRASKTAGMNKAAQAGRQAGMSTKYAGRQGTVEKRQKVCSAQRKGTPPPLAEGGASAGGSVGAQCSRTLTVSISNKKLYLCYMKKGIGKMSIIGQPGLTVKNGRLINNLPDGTMGIQAAADARKLRKREEKIEMMVEADVRASMREKLLGLES